MSRFGIDQLKKKPFLKEVLLALAIFVMPLAPYLHIFFIDYQSDSSLQSFFIDKFHGNIESFVYQTLYFLGYFLVYFLWYKESIVSYRLLILTLALIQLVNALKNSIVVDDKLILLLVFCFLILIFFKHYRRKKHIDSNGQSTLMDEILLLFLFLLVLLSCSYLFYPNDTDSLDFLFFKIGKNGFLDARTHLFIIVSKLSLLFSLIVWFLVEKKWYKYGLFSSIILLTNQLYNVMYTISSLDEFELSQSGPILLVTLLGLIFLGNAAKAQERVSTFFNKIYIQLEKKIQTRYQERENYIQAKREKLDQFKIADIKGLENLKQQLEKELKKDDL